LSAAPIRIDFVSDITCPWCVIGLRGLLAALQKLEGEVVADLRLGAFELNPDMAPEGENTAEHVTRKYGSTPERSAQVRDVIRDNGATLGFTFNYGPETRIWNTFDAHRLLHWAAREGRHVALKDELFKATFTDQFATSDPEVLANAAAAAGLDPERARQILASDEFARNVREEENLWRSRGIQSVPSVIFNEHWLIQGAQPPEVYEQAIRQIVTGTAAEE
jgi:predicted DsbA family dithiol-disulfide isomerase